MNTKTKLLVIKLFQLAAQIPHSLIQNGILVVAVSDIPKGNCTVNQIWMYNNMIYALITMCHSDVNH